MHPNRTQERELHRYRRACGVLWNAALEERQSAYRARGGCLLARTHLSYIKHQSPAVKDIRHEPCFAGVPTAILHRTLRRVDRAYQTFYRVIKSPRRGKKKGLRGMPRFRRVDEYPGWDHGGPAGRAWRLSPIPPGKVRGRHLEISGVGAIKIAGKMPAIGEYEARDLTVTWTGRKWLASIVFRFDVEPGAPGEKAMAFDWGVKTYATIASSDGSVVEVGNPKWDQCQQDKTLAVQQKIARRWQGRGKKQSNGWRKAKQEYTDMRARASRQRRDFQHRLTAEWVREYGHIATESLKVRNMTATAKGSEEKPGKNVAQKAGLNRAILETAPAALVGMLKYKCEQRGVVFCEVDTRKVKPSQRCAVCGNTQKMPLSERTYSCKKCGNVSDRDVNAAQTILRASLEQEVKAPIARACGNVGARKAPASPRSQPVLSARCCNG